MRIKLAIFSVFIMSSAANAVTGLKPLESSLPLTKTVSIISQQMADDNISGCGQSTATAYKVSNGLKDWNTIAAELLKESFGEDYSSPKEIKVKVSKFSNKAVAATVKALTVAYDYDPDYKEAQTALTRKVWAMLRKLDISETSLVVAAKVKVDNGKGSCTDQPQSIVSMLFINTKSKQAVQIFAAQGFM